MLFCAWYCWQSRHRVAGVVVGQPYCELSIVGCNRLSDTWTPSTALAKLKNQIGVA